jgi:hypothetical protein
MMIIDVITDKGINWMRYSSDIIPRLGETLTTLKPEKKEFVIISVDHLIGPKFNSDEMRQELVTLIVKEN